MLTTPKLTIDPFAKERYLLHAMKKQDSSSDAVKQILENYGLAPIPPPQKGQDYFTEAEIEQFKSEIFKRIVPPTVNVDYDLLEKFLQSRIDEAVSKIKPAKKGDPGDPGEPGTNAVLNIKELANQVLSLLPKTKREKLLTMDEVRKTFQDYISQIPPRVVQYGGSPSSLRLLTDVVLTGVPQDIKGNYILTPSGGSGHTIQDEGTPLTARTNLNFVGAGVTVTDGGAGPNSTIVTIPGGSGSGITRVISSINTPTTAPAVASTDYVYFVSGTTTLTLPTAVGNLNRYTVKRVGVNTVTVATTSAQTIDGSATALLNVQYQSLDLVSDGANWNVV